jgi:hypothetical protein
VSSRSRYGVRDAPVARSSSHSAFAFHAPPLDHDQLAVEPVQRPESEISVLKELRQRDVPVEGAAERRLDRRGLTARAAGWPAASRRGAASPRGARRETQARSLGLLSWAATSHESARRIAASHEARPEWPKRTSATADSGAFVRFGRRSGCSRAFRSRRQITARHATRRPPGRRMTSSHVRSMPVWRTRVWLAGVSAGSIGFRARHGDTDGHSGLVDHRSDFGLRPGTRARGDQRHHRPRDGASE